MCKHFSSLCRSSLCDQIRLLYFKISSCGALTYTGVPSTSATNSNHRFSNGAHLKVPAYLGGVSIFVCFVIALLSLGLSFAIVPRQVMPWTGLLLVYEWTFTLFILLFGGFLNLIYQWGRTVAFQEGSFSSHRESVDYGSGKGHQRQASACDFVTWLGLMVAGSIVLASFMAYASEHLAICSFSRGLEGRDFIRTRSACLLC